MHPLIPDDWKLFEHQNGELLEEREFDELQGANTRSFMDEHNVSDLIYSLGGEHPGAITLHNYPAALQRHRRIDGELMDLATMDIIRDRERGVPRYNDFREQMRMPRVRSFEELTENPLGRGDPRVYDNDIDKSTSSRDVRRTGPAGLRFSDTASVFILRPRVV